MGPGIGARREPLDQSSHHVAPSFASHFELRFYAPRVGSPSILTFRPFLLVFFFSILEQKGMSRACNEFKNGSCAIYHE